MKFFHIIENDKTGLFYPNEELDTEFIQNGKPIPSLGNLTFELRDGTYGDYMSSVKGGDFVSEELMELFKSYLTPSEKVDFIPVEVKSDQYGDRTYYIMHFEKVYGEIDKDHSRCDMFSGAVIIPCFDYDSIEGLNVFPISHFSNDLVVSDTLRKEMKKRKLDDGFEFNRAGVWNKNKNAWEN